MHQPGTWRRLKIATEVRLGYPLPRLPEIELVRLLGLLAGVRDGQAAKVLQDDAEQERRGNDERRRSALGLEDACRALAKVVDVRPHL